MLKAGTKEEKHMQKAPNLITICVRRQILLLRREYCTFGNREYVKPRLSILELQCDKATRKVYASAVGEKEGGGKHHQESIPESIV
nr:hypothetical protein [Tanacetum cinerariifolium]